MLHTLHDVSGVSLFDDAVEFSPDSKLVAFKFENTLRVWDVNTGTPQPIIDLDPDRMDMAKFPPDSELVAFITRFGLYQSQLCANGWNGSGEFFAR